jgi:hypothetical protein
MQTIITDWMTDCPEDTNQLTFCLDATITEGFQRLMIIGEQRDILRWILDEEAEGDLVVFLDRVRELEFMTAR